MAALDCSHCGGRIEIFNADATVGRCPFCESLITIPKSYEKKGGLFNRANFLRQKKEFDKAAEVFEDILKEDNTDAEAHWGVLMCRYGIEYVVDPATQKRIPTCHRTEKGSIFNDSSYQAAMEFADENVRQVHKYEASQIDKIQQKILQIVEKEEPYDVFICYKRSDDYGERTSDSYLGSDIYQKLTRAGYKVFFAEESIPLGTKDYEPYIYAALFSSRVMIVVATKPEYTEAVWVRNEWSRFLAMMRKDPDKTIIPVYQDISPYDLPKELSHFQALDAHRLGYIQELQEGINRIVRKKQPQQQPVYAARPAGLDIDNYLKRVSVFLEDGDFDKAKSYCNKVLDTAAEESRAYWYLMLCDLKCHSAEEVGKLTIELNDQPNYQKAIRFATPQLKTKYEAVKAQCDEKVAARNEMIRLKNEAAAAKEQRRQNYHANFEALRQRYFHKDPRQNAIFGTWKNLKDQAASLDKQINGVKGAKAFNWIVLVLGLVMAAAPLYLYYIVNPTRYHDFGNNAAVLQIILVILLVLLFGVLVGGIAMLVTGSGCIAVVLGIIVGFCLAGNAAETILNAIRENCLYLYSHPYYLIVAVVGIILMVLQIMRMVKRSAAKSRKASLTNQLQNVNHQIEMEWQKIRNFAGQELRQLNDANQEFEDEHHDVDELFK